MGRFPLPLCSTCVDFRDCTAVGEPKPDYPRCHHALRSTTVAAQRQLAVAAGGDERCRKTVDMLIERFQTERKEYAEIFEWSLSWDAGGMGRMRCSYGFPGWGGIRNTARGERRHDIRIAILRAAAPWRLQTKVMHTLGLLDHPAVAQPLVGTAGDGRYKLYLQLHDNHPETPAFVTNALGSIRPLPGVHMLGFDFNAQGEISKKVYSVDIPPPLPLAVKRALVVRRGAALTPTEVDFSLVDNDFTEADVLAAMRPSHPEAIAAWEEWAGRFPVALRRVSIGIDRPRMVFYYVSIATE